MNMKISRKNQILALVILCFVFLIRWGCSPVQPSSPKQSYKIIYPEKGRPISHYDWENDRYVYMDQIKSDTYPGGFAPRVNSVLEDLVEEYINDNPDFYYDHR